MAQLFISSEEDAYSTLQMALKGKIPQGATLKFGDWANLHFVARGDEFNASITPPIMVGLLDYQRGIYRAFAAVKYGDPAKRLSDSEKQALQINVKVSKGSAQYDVSTTELLKHFISEVAVKMPPEYVVISVLSVAVMYFGTSFLKTMLDNRKDVRIKEVSDETQRATLEAMRFSAEQETKRAAILAQAIQKQPSLQFAAAEATDAHSALVKSIRAARDAEISGVHLDREEAVVLTRNGRSDVTQARLDGKYRLLKLDWSEPGVFRVKVQRINDSLLLDADVQDDTLTGAYKDILKEAEWQRKPVFLSINAKKVGDNYREAVIVKVEKLGAKRSRIR